MLELLWLYISDELVGWHTASLVAATTAGKGNGLAWSLQVWTWDYLEDETQLPVSNYGKHMQSIIQDKDLAEEIHMHLQSLGKKYLHALDIVEYLDKPKVKVQLRLTKTPSERTALCWMHAMEYQYGVYKNGMYVDGHECANVVKYWMDVFLLFWASIEGEM